MEILLFLKAILVAITGGNIWATGGLIAIILGFLLKRFVTNKVWDAVGDAIENLFFTVGTAITEFMNGITKGIWNKVIEPPFQLFLKVFFDRALIGIQRGLDSDDKIE